MFKSAARKMAHNPTIAGFAGKQDLRALQDLITSEKAILNSLQKLSSDFARASDALRLWGQGEGEDLGDILTASNALLLHFSSALGTLASHETTIREQMKAVRTREENLDELKRRRKSVFSDAEGAERKLSKMSPENKNLQQQTDHLNRLREEIRQMDGEIMAEEADLGDFKRASVRAWMGRKFGGLWECCEKGTIVGELGKLAISEISLEPTQPGLPRPYYTGHPRTEFLVAEAARSVSEVPYSPEPNPNPSHNSIRPLPGSELPPVPSPSQQRRMSVVSANGNPYTQPGYPPSSPPSGAYPGLPQVEESGFNIQQFAAPNQLSQLPMGTSPPINEFGTYTTPITNQASSYSLTERENPSSPPAGRFVTFPVKALGPRPPPGAAQSSLSSIPSTNPYISAPPMRDGDRVPSLEIDRTPHDESFSSSVAQALNQYSLGGPSSSASGPGPSVGAGSSRFTPPGGIPLVDVKGGADFGPQRYSPPPPMYTPSDGRDIPAGAAPSHPPTAMQDGLEAPAREGKGASRPSSTFDDEDGGGLAYMSARGNESAESLSDNGDRRVRFGGVSDVDQELERRHQKEEEKQTQAKAHEWQQEDEHEHEPAKYARVPVPSLDQGPEDLQNGWTSVEKSPAVGPSPVSPTHSDTARRTPSPTMSSPQLRSYTPPAKEVLTDEQSLNAAAVREVSRELDVLMMTGSPPMSPAQDRPPPSPLSMRPTQPSYGPAPYQNREPSPLQSLNTAPRPSSQPTSPQTMSPRAENIYVRERDRSASSSVRRATMPDQTSEAIPPPTSPTMSDGGDQIRPPINLPPAVQSTSTDSNGTPSPYRTPMGTPSGMAPPHPMYSLPGLAGSNGSFSNGAPRKIPAAAFRRPQPPLRNFSSDSLGMADTSPLNVKKRPLPAFPYPSTLQPATGQGMRAVSAPLPNEQQRPISHYREDGAEEEDFDYISAYTDNPDRASGYGSGHFATNLEEGNGVR